MSKRTWFFLLLVAFPLAAQNPSVDVLHYRIDVTIPQSMNEITAATELTVRPLVTPLETLAAHDLERGHAVHCMVIGATAFPAATRPASVVLDPDEWVLKQIVAAKRRAARES